MSSSSLDLIAGGRRHSDKREEGTTMTQDYHGTSIKFHLHRDTTNKNASSHKLSSSDVPSLPTNTLPA